MAKKENGGHRNAWIYLKNHYVGITLHFDRIKDADCISYFIQRKKNGESYIDTVRSMIRQTERQTRSAMEPEQTIVLNNVHQTHTRAEERKKNEQK